MLRRRKDVGAGGSPTPILDVLGPEYVPAGLHEPVAPWTAQTGSISPLGTTPIGEVAYRTRARIHGKVRSVRVRPWADVPTLECTVVDDTGGITVVFLGRRSVGGIGPGTSITAEGVVGQHHDRLAILNPAYDLRRS